MAKNNLIISFNGDEGSGKSTIAKMLAEQLHIPHFYMGQIFRDTAKAKDITLAEFVKAVETTPEWEKEIDDYVSTLPRTEKTFVIESRTAWHFIPQSLKIYLKVSEQEGARRIFKHLQVDQNRNEGTDLDSVEKIMLSTSKRRAEDDRRYRNLYDINVREEENFDLIVDTTHLTIDEAYKKVFDFINEKIN